MSSSRPRTTPTPPICFAHGFAARADRRVLDFADRAEELEPADVVVLHRVVCCYPDYETLVGAAADHARDQLLLTFPRDVWWTRLGLGTINRLQRLRRNAFRVYLHAPAAILDVACSHGLESPPVSEAGSRSWSASTPAARRVDVGLLALGASEPAR